MEYFNISPVAMFQQAGIIGKIVMATLLLASIWCWIIIIESAYVVFKLKRLLQQARNGASSPFQSIEAEGAAAALRLIPHETAGEKRQRISETMNRSMRQLLMRSEGGLPNLAVISSVAPFIGLFGTVWGIMTSFTGIAEAKDTSLAIVAPGIAEALATTAYGLFAAIPASIGYTRIGASFFRLGVAFSDLIENRAIDLMARKENDPENAGTGNP